MRYLIFSSVLMLFLFGNPATGRAQNSNSFTPPNRVQANFNARYPDYTGATKWKETANGYQATIRQNNKEIVSTFDSEGRWVDSRTIVKESDLPAPAKQYLKDSYSLYEFRSGSRYDTKESSRYQIDIRSRNKDYRLEFDKKGSFIKESLPSAEN